MRLRRLSIVLLGPLLASSTSVAGATGDRPAASAELILSGDLVRDGARLEVIEEQSGAIRTFRWEGKPTSVSVPATRVVLCTFDPSGRATGLFRLVPNPGDEIHVDRLSSPPREKGQLYLTLAFPSTGEGRGIQRDVAARLVVGERPYPPDVAIRSGDLLRFFWFGAPSGYATVDVLSQFWATEKTVDLTVPQRTAIALRPVELHRRPALRVRLDGSERLPAGDVKFELFPCDKFKEFVDNLPRLSDCESPIVRTGKADDEFVFPGLVPATYAYRWHRGDLSAAGWLRVPDFEDLEKHIRVDLYDVTGAVRRHGQGISARLVFEPPNTGGRFETDADEEGRYRVTLAGRARYSVRVTTGGFPEFPDSVDVQRDTTKDFDLPSNRYRVVVVSADEGKPMAQVRIDYEVQGTAGGRNGPFSGKGFTGADGVLDLAPVPSGELLVRARQLGYRPVAVSPIRVDDTSAGDDIPISLVKAPTITIRLLEPDGAPAAGGFVWAETGGIRGAPFTGDDGTTVFDVELPTGAPLFAFDTKGRMAFARYGGQTQQDVRIPASGPPVSIRLQTATGEPVAGVFVRVGMDGVLMEYGPIAQQAYWSGTQWRSTPDGAARIFGLPADGLLTVFPSGGPEYSVTRRLPLSEDIVITLPAREPQRPKMKKQAPEQRTAEAVPR